MLPLSASKEHWMVEAFKVTCRIPLFNYFFPFDSLVPCFTVDVFPGFTLETHIRRSWFPNRAKKSRALGDGSRLSNALVHTR